VTISAQDERRVCIKAEANDCNKKGAFAAGTANVLIVRSVPAP
jgi:hypothetical protein